MSPRDAPRRPAPEGTGWRSVLGPSGDRGPVPIGRSRHAGLALLAAAGVALVAAPPASAVIAGHPSPVAGTPWVVQVGDARGVFCTGSLIRPTIVLTAAHCVRGQTRRVRVIAGRQRTDGSGGTVVRAVRRAFDQRFVTRHEGAKVVASDVGLLQLERPLDGVAPIALAGPGQASLLATNAPVTVTGWGLRTARVPRRPVERTLRSATIPLRSRSFCDRVFHAPTPGVLCAGRLNRPVAGACYGDSGGPLYAATPAGPSLVGVVSSGSARCGDAPTWYARVQSGPGRAWIDAHITPEGAVVGGARVR